MRMYVSMCVHARVSARASSFIPHNIRYNIYVSYRLYAHLRAGEECPGVHELVHHSIQRSDTDLRRGLYSR